MLRSRSRLVFFVGVLVAWATALIVLAPAGAELCVTPCFAGDTLARVECKPVVRTTELPPHTAPLPGGVPGYSVVRATSGPARTSFRRPGVWLLSGDEFVPTALSAKASVRLDVADLLGDTDALLITPDGIRRPVREEARASFSPLPANALRSAVLVLGTAVPASEASETVLLVGFPDPEGVAAKWKEVLAGLPSASAGTSSAPLVLVHEPAEDDALPEITLGSAAVLPLSPENPLSWEELVAHWLAQAPAPAPAGAEWFAPSLSRRRAIRAAAAAGLYEEDERWNAIRESYVFMAPSRKARLADHARDVSNQPFLEDCKGPLALKFIEQALWPSAPDPLEAWNEVGARVAAGESLAQSLSASFGPAAAALADRLQHASLGLEEFAVPEPLALTRSPRVAPPEGERLEVTFALSANTDGFLETCGCRAQQAGGLARRATVLARARASGDVVALDLGNAWPRMIPSLIDELTSGECKLQRRVLSELAYAAQAVGANELYMGPDAMRSVFSQPGPPIVCANLAPSSPASDELPIVPAIRYSAGGLSMLLVGATSTSPYWFSAEEFRRRTGAVRPSSELDCVRPIEALARSDDLVVVFGDILPSRIPGLLAAAPRIDLVVSSANRILAPADADDPWRGSFARSGFHGDTLVLFTAADSASLSLVRVVADARGTIRAFDEENVILDALVPEATEIRALLDAFYMELPGAGEPSALEDELTRARLASGELRYVGAEACANCHAADHLSWANTPHAGAFRTLSEKHRDSAATCLPCHTVGYGYSSGFSLQEPESSRRLRGVQCEVCHGPGNLHVQNPLAGAAIRATVGLEFCARCHDQEHSPPLDGRLEEAFRTAAHKIPAPR